MTSKSLAAIGVIGALAAVTLILPPAVGVATAQVNPGAARAATPARNFKAPRTPWGDPDLQGVWSSDDMRNVPLQRPVELGERRFLNDDEYAKRLESEAKFRSENVLAAAGVFRGDFGTRVFRHASLISDPPDGRLPAVSADVRSLAAAGAARRGGLPESWEDRSLYDRCITRGVVGSSLPTLYGNGNQIFQGTGYVAISYEMIHDTRIIPLDRRPHVGKTIKTWMGDARGHWEGDTLVVETSNFMDRRTAVGGVPHSDALVLVERFTRIANDMIDYEVTVDDPKTFGRPWTINFPFTTTPGYQVYEYACHEGNLAIPNILSGARAHERNVKDAVARGLPLRPRSGAILRATRRGASSGERARP